MNALTDAVEGLYRALAAPMPETLDHCTHCLSVEDAKPFTTVPLRELTAAQVDKYWLNGSTVGDEAFQRYLLPRLLDLVAQGAFPAWVAGDFLEQASRGCWTWAEPPAGELAAVRTYLVELLRYRLRHPLRDTEDLDIKDLLERVSEAHDDLGPVLAEVEQVPEEMAGVVEASLWNLDHDEHLGPWLRSPGLLAAMERAALGPDPDGRYSDLHQQLEWSQRA